MKKRNKRILETVANFVETPLQGKIYVREFLLWQKRNIILIQKFWKY